MTRGDGVHTANEVLAQLTPRQIERFWSKVDRQAEGCWEWRGCVHPRGYGTWTVSRPDGRSTSVRPHRVAWFDARGPIPDGLVIDHLCGRKTCVNPDHLEPVGAEVNGSRSPRDVLAALNAEAEIASLIRAAKGDPNRAAAAIVRAILAHPGMLELMPAPRSGC